MGPGGGHGQRIVQKPKNTSSTLKKLLKYLGSFKLPMLVTLILAIGATILTIVGPKLMGNMINILAEDFVQRFTNPLYEYRFDQMGWIALQLLAFYLIALVANLISGWVITGVTVKVVKKFRTEISQKINRLPISYCDKHPFGDTLSRVTNDVELITQSLQQTISQLISSVTMILGFLVMMLTISWQLTIIAMLTIPVSFLFIRFVTTRTQKLFKAQQNELGNLNGQIEEVYAGQVLVRAFSAEDEVMSEFSKTNDKLHKAARKSQFLSGLMHPIMNAISNLGYVATAIAGGYFVVNGRLGLGDLTAFIQYVNQFTQPITQLSQIFNVLQSAMAASERVFDFLEEPEQSPDKIEEELSSILGAVEFKDVHFSYEEDEEVIKGFSAKIKPGAKVAIVGPTGAGKTTIVNLLMRFYDPNSGEIVIDGINTKKLARANVRKSFGMVLQDTWLMNGTIADNLRYGKLDATEKEVKRAAKLAHVDHMIESLPKAYKTVISEDSEAVSAGEKQLLTIARAMIADPPMMILDEATSSVDTRTEQLIQSAMDNLSSGRTSFIIAHRLSTIKNADLILVMQDGNIVEQGNHVQLLKKNGVYAGLYNSQFVED
ncbi:MAG: ABC transporter ATP-binding protein/permease [Candidatus Nomurabacteria bacterium]|jgi:ATP-binding cassette subfamily B protein|nr:ABC transporter ATP-binding protein/permease [Candidatus Nomurabacteria bacterium]